MTILLPALPEEVWNEIFTYLSPRDILQLTRVSRLFREIVNKSSSLTSKLTLNFAKRKSYGHKGRRRYGKLTVDYVDQSIHINILKFIGTDITHLEFRFCNFQVDSVRQILNLCEHVKVLKFIDIQRLHGLKDVVACEKIPKYKQIELVVEQCDPRIFKILKSVQARKLQVTCVEFAHRQHFSDMVEFLKAQEKLEELKLSEFSGSIVGLALVLFSNDSLCDVKFRLKKLQLLSNQLIPYGHIDSPQFFATFMDVHKESLEELEADMLQDFDFTSFIAECKKLKTLIVGVDMRISSKVVVPNVEKLQTEHVRMNLLKSFPNVKELTLLNTWYDYGNDDIVKWSLLKNCEHLEKLTVVDVPLDDFPSLPTLKSLKLGWYVSIKSEVFARNPQIEELTFEECRDMSTRKSKVLKIIIDYVRNLKSLKIATRSRIDKSAIEYVKRRCTNLKYFNVYKDEDYYDLWM